LRKCKEDDEKAEKALRAREEAVARYKEEVAQQRDLRLKLFEEQKLEEMRFAEEGKKREEFKRRVVAEARRKLLQEHAAALRGFLPRGVIVSPADLDILKAFDGNKDGVLEPEEMALAQAAFEAWDPGAVQGGGDSPSNGGGASVRFAPMPPAAAVKPPPPQQSLQLQGLPTANNNRSTAQQNRQRQQQSSIF